MSEVFQSAWEGSGVLDGTTWTGQNGSGRLSVATDYKLQGNQSLKYTGSGIHNIYKTIAPISTCGFRFAIRLSSALSDLQPLAALGDSGNYVVVFRADGSTNKFRVQNYNNSQYVGSDFTYTDDTWYQVEIKYVAGTSISWKVWDATGTTLVHTEQTTSTGVSATSVETILVGFFADPGGTLNFWWDAVKIDNANYPGPAGGSLQYDYDTLMFYGCTYDIENSAVSPEFFIDINRVGGSNPDEAKINNSAGGTTTILPISLQLTINNLIAGSDVIVYEAGTETVLDSVQENGDSDWSYNYDYVADTHVDIGVFKVGYRPYYVRNYLLPAASGSLPVAQQIDRDYLS